MFTGQTVVQEVQQPNQSPQKKTFIVTLPKTSNVAPPRQPQAKTVIVTVPEKQQEVQEDVQTFETQQPEQAQVIRLIPLISSGGTFFSSHVFTSKCLCNPQ